MRLERINSTLFNGLNAPHLSNINSSRTSIRTNMKFSLTLPIVLSTLYISFSQAQNNSLTPCGKSCATTEGSQTGCDMCAFSIRIMLHPCLTRPPITELIRNVFVRVPRVPCSSQLWKLVCLWNVTATSWMTSWKQAIWLHFASEELSQGTGE